MSWFVWACGAGSRSLVDRAMRSAIPADTPPTVVGEDGFCLAYASRNGRWPPEDTDYARSAEGALLLVGHVTDWTRLESLSSSGGPRRPGESRTHWLLRVHHARGSFDWVDCLDGAFAIVLHDHGQEAVCVARDPMGGLPVFWVRTVGSLVLSSHLSTLLTLPDVSTQLDEEEVCRYLFHNQISDTSATLVKSIRQVRADERMRLASDGTTCLHKWTPRIAAILNNDQDTVSELRLRLECAIDAATRGSQQPAVALSGGLDSSALAALLARQRDGGTVTTHSVAYAQFPAERARISTFIQAVPVKSTLVTPQPEEFLADLETLVRVTELPFLHPGFYTHFRAYRSAGSAGADVVLIGEGADGSFAARARYGSLLVHDLVRSEGIRHAFRETQRLARNHGWNFVLGERVLRLLPPRLQARVLWRAWGCDVPAGLRNSLDGFAPRVSRGSLTPVLAGDLSSLFAPEMWQYRRMGSHFGLEVRYPFLDARVTEWTLALPARLRLHDGLLKWALRASLAGIVPDEVRMSREKLGFTFPFYSWVSRQLQGLFRNALQDAARRPYGDAVLLGRRFDAYLTSPTWRHENAIWRVVNLEAWRRLVLERESLPDRWLDGVTNG